ncbi:uncharacterized protein BT62DRAFT_1013343 [Guyanagaster necrorhizus]|uniref:Uncharacterized protein n=1 Tax=Guyanagaster necrorhizus TaxID=856835 RepID=A0A9P7VG11_9AGAR|nr:uncharacterized protein BT62DRAFT_1013343 [Guyanagaster necrorhizus MCA 3950]KAG7439892.1 hypothetical protein BT62DRAFT_1013343 [Guyanagaster necrorhizus MCA 3950]
MIAVMPIMTSKRIISWQHWEATTEHLSRRIYNHTSKCIPPKLMTLSVFPDSLTVSQAFELVTDYQMFSQEDFDSAAHIPQITGHIGKIPSTFLSECAFSARFFARNGELWKIKDWDECSIEATVEGFQMLNIWI